MEATRAAFAEEAYAPDDVPSLRRQVYDDLRFRLIMGKIAPAAAISTRGLAQQLGVSQMPARFAEIMRCRLLLEPAAAADALAYIDKACLKEIRRADDATAVALRSGDINAYMESNFRFHSLICRARPMALLNRLIEMLWMQFGPFMRIVYGRFGNADLLGRHVVATQAIVDRDAARLEKAIHDDIGDGMNVIRVHGLP